MSSALSAASLRPMAVPAANTHGGDPLLAQFGAFYSELLRIKSALAVGGRRVGRVEGLDVARVSETVHLHLRTMLERQEGRARQWGGAYGQALHAEAQYIMAALADETLLLRVEWGGNEIWQDCLLETALFGTCLAGERVFERLDLLLTDPARAHPSLAAIYLIALALGFRGRYWRPEDEDQIRLYRTMLARIVTRAVPDADILGPYLFAQSYQCTVTEGQAVRLPGLRPWLAAIAAVVVLFLIVSNQLWGVATADLRYAIAQVERPLQSLR